jgi:hypothetical protein
MSLYGIRILEADNNIIGGNWKRNVVSGNGVSITGSSYSPSAGIDIERSDGNTIQNSYIGTDESGTMAVPNFVGINIRDSKENNIGGYVSFARNVISGNRIHGIRFTRVTKTKIRDNYIGTNADGTQALGNRYGVYLSESSDNTIGEPSLGPAT